MKTSKRIVSFLLSAIMVVTTFLAVGPVFTINAEAADITLGGITQKHVVDDYEAKYKEYQAKFFSGTGADNWPTTMVIPGLGTEDYTPQGMTYWHAKEWILVSAYDAGSGTKKNSVIYAIDIKTGNFVALFKIFNSDGTINTSHGGGIAVSEYNFYYADKSSYISYWPLSEMDVADGTVKDIAIKGSIDCSGELFGGKQTDKDGNVKNIADSAATSYCCYDDGILWTGNFYHTGDSDNNPQYGNSANSKYNSMVMGYKLHGDSSEQEWHYLASRSIPITVTNASGTWDNGAGTTMPYTVTKDNSDGSIDIRGTVNNTSGSTLGEVTLDFASFYLNKGQEYVIEFTSTNNLSDMYMFSPSGNHCNVKQSQASKITNNGDGTYTYRMTFTAGTKPSGADSSWGDGTYTGKYTVRFDQDSVAAGTREFKITDFTIKPKTNATGADATLAGSNCAGNPTYCIALGTDIDRVQYAMVDKGKLYISRSWSRYESAAHIRELDIADININYPGTEDLTVNGQTRKCHVIKTTDSTFKKFGGTKSDASRTQMPFMGEALCVIDDYLYMFTEGAAYSYRVETSGGNTCPEPIDVIWKIDQYAIAGNPRPIDDVDALRYEKVNSISDIQNGEEYIIVHQSTQKDRTTQKNILYALDSYGGYNGLKIPKSESTNQMNIGDSMGMVGYKITSYTLDGNYLYLDDTDDARKSIRWTLNDVPVAASGGYFNATLKNSDYYYSSSPELYFNERAVTMCSDADKQTYDIQFFELGNGNFYLLSGSAYFLWCNDGSYPEYLDTYTNYYKNHNQTGYTPVYEGLTEVAGTFHTDALLSGGSATGNKIGKLPESQYNLAYFNIYKRVPDEHTAVGDSKVYTDLKAEVQSDGSIDLLMETYATERLHYKTLSAKRPTDYIFVLDKSGSTDQSGGTGYRYWNSPDKMTLASIVNYSSGGVFDVDDEGYIHDYDACSNCYFITSDGEYRLLKLAAKTITNKWYDGWKRQYFWVYYQGGDGLYYVFDENQNIRSGITWAQFESNVANNANISVNAYSNSENGRAQKVVYEGEHYSLESVNRLRQMQNLAIQLTYDIAADAAATGLDHRIAVCRLGYQPQHADSNADTTTAYYKAGNTTRIDLVTEKDANGNNTYKSTQDFSGVFNTTSQFGTVRTIINDLKTGGHSNFAYAMYTMIPKMIDASGKDYSYSGDRSVCVIMITDGGIASAEDVYTIDGSGAGSACSSTIMGAKEIKESGGFIHTVRVGHEDIAGTDWNEDHQLSCISSDFISAKSGSDTGDPSPWAVDFSHTFETTAFDPTTASSTIMAQVNESRKYSLAKLDASAIVREKLNSTAFQIENSEVEAGTVDAYYDGAMRLRFRDTVNSTGITSKLNTNGEFEITGFDFSKYYISQANATAGNAKKLVIRVKDVKIKSDVANNSDVTNDIVNVGVSDPTPTGVYQNATAMAAKNKHKDFPDDRLVIPQYTYVLDYGVGMLDVDINGTLKSVDTTFQKQSSYSTTKAGAGTRLQFTNNNQDMIYSIDQGTTQLQRYYVLIQRPNGEYDWFAINIVPASTVYYEENIFSNYISGNTRWSSEGNATVTNQGISLWDDVYGYDEKYLADTSNNSGGTVLTTTVNSGNKQSDTYRTNFIGDAFDLYSACGDSTGILVVGVRKNDRTNNGRGTLVKSYVVDTFYNDSAYGTLYQVPVIHCEDLAYGNYFVEITSAYLSISGKLRSQSIATEIIDENGVISYTSDFTNDTESVILEELGFAELDPENTEFIWYSEDSVLNGGMGAQGVNNGSFTTQADGDVTLTSYIDGLRAYNPTNGVSSYYKAEEQDAKYYNVFDNMKAGTFTGNGVSYLLGGTAGGTTLNFATELESLFQGRPKNEVYLENGNKITFTVNGLDTDSRVMVSLRAAAGTPKASVNNKQFNVTSKMEMYYDVTDYVTKSSDGKSATVIIENVSGGMLAIDNIKLTGKETTLSGQSLLSDIIEIFAEPVEEVVPNQPKPQVSENSGEIPAPPELPDVSDPDDGNDDNGNDDIVPPSGDNNNPEEPAEDGFFAKVESFFVKIFNFFKNIFNKVSSFFEF